MIETKKSVLSGWLSKWLFALLTAGVCWSQDVSDSRPATLQSQFSTAALAAYQDNGDGKIRDFYQYLNLLSDTEDVELKVQLQQSIYALFEDRNVVVQDILSETTAKIPLSYLLENVFGRKIKFALLVTKPSDQIKRDFWTDDYSLQVSSPERTKTMRLSQVVYLRTKSKQFGESVKSVWNLSLGAFSVSD